MNRLVARVALRRDDAELVVVNNSFIACSVIIQCLGDDLQHDLLMMKIRTVEQDERPLSFRLNVDEKLVAALCTQIQGGGRDPEGT
ncbi:hypothetical protein MKW98_005751 [Papaver atlanticum]|uniref:Uncharacterized protein n=1 Tax=Papaver atlanticum TaxID=357466 RepID=A0AAD4S0D7_9MAGN|nr:hypothetical protein MKW98_005751 [Papaver atlanticum]